MHGAPSLPLPPCYGSAVHWRPLESPFWACVLCLKAAAWRHCRLALGWFHVQLTKKEPPLPHNSVLQAHPPPSTRALVWHCNCTRLPPHDCPPPSSVLSPNDVLRVMRTPKTFWILGGHKLGLRAVPSCRSRLCPLLRVLACSLLIAQWSWASDRAPRGSLRLGTKRNKGDNSRNRSAERVCMYGAVHVGYCWRARHGGAPPVPPGLPGNIRA